MGYATAIRLLPMVAVGSVVYVLGVMLLDRQLIRHFLTFVGQSTQTRG
jgi:hypothetical protein